MFWTIAALLAGIATLSSAAPACAQDPDSIIIQKLSERVIVLHHVGRTSPNLVTAIATDKGVVVIDTEISFSFARETRAAIERELGRSDFAYVINTHEDLDHIGGNQVYPEAEIIAHENFRQLSRRFESNPEIYLDASWFSNQIEYMHDALENLEPNSERAEQLRIDIALFSRVLNDFQEGQVLSGPTIAFNDRLTIDMGDVSLKLIFFDAAHSNSDILIVVPEENLVCVGDLFHPWSLIPAGANSARLDIPRWIDILDEVMAPENGIDRIVSGHLSIMQREEMQVRADYVRELWQGVRDAKADGLDLAGAQERLSLDGQFSFIKNLQWRPRDLNRLPRFHQSAVAAFWRQLQVFASEAVEQCLRNKGIEAARARFEEIKNDSSDSYYISEGAFNTLGYRFLREGNTEAAIAVFRMNVELFPGSANAYDSLGEAYMTAAQNDLAVQSYRRSLELNPENDNARQMLERLGADR